MTNELSSTRDVRMGGGAERGVIQVKRAARDLDARVAVAFEMRVGDAGFRRAHSPIDDQATPTRRRARQEREPDRRRLGALRDQPAAIGHGQVHARTEIDRRARLEGEGRSGVHREIGGDVVGAACRRPKRVRGDGAADGLYRTVVVPDVECRTFDFAVLVAQRLHEHAVQAGVQADTVVRPGRLPGGPLRGLPLTNTRRVSIAFALPDSRIVGGWSGDTR